MGTKLAEMYTHLSTKEFCTQYTSRVLDSTRYVPLTLPIPCTQAREDYSYFSTFSKLDSLKYNMPTTDKFIQHTANGVIYEYNIFWYLQGDLLSMLTPF